MRWTKKSKTELSTDLRGPTSHDCSSVDVMCHTNFLHVTTKSNPVGALTSELFS